MKKIFFIYLILSSIIYADIILTDNKDIYDNFPILYTTDKLNNSDIESINKLNFNKKTTSNFSLGYGNKIIWLKFNINNSSTNEKFILYLNEFFYQRVELFTKERGNWKIQKNGFLNQNNNHSNIFKLDIQKHSKKIYYMKLESKTAKFGSLSLYEINAFYSSKTFNKDTLYIFIFGVLFIIMIFTIFLSLQLKDKIYNYYLGYTFFYLIYLINQSGFFSYLGLSMYNYEIQAFSGFILIFFIHFSIALLNIKKILPKINKSLNFISYSFLLLTPLYILYYSPWNKISNNLNALASIILIVCSFYIYIKGDKRIKYYIFATTLFFTFVVVFSLMISGKLPYNNITRYGFIIASTIETIIFSLMLSNRYNDMKNEIIKVQKELIIIKNENENFLEKKIEERTVEIRKTYIKVKKLSDERELLLREVYHRVKNNFQVIISIIWFESKKFPQSKQNFMELISRIKSMSTVHEFLYNSKDLSKINLLEYLDKIILNLIMIYEKKDLDIKKEIERITTDFNSAVSLGVIINEVLSNAIKHHPQEQKCNIDINLEKKETSIYLTIQDNGKGFSLKDTNKGIGIELIKEFAKKLKGTYKFTFDKGTKFEIIFQSNQKAD